MLDATTNEYLIAVNIVTLHFLWQKRYAKTIEDLPKGKVTEIDEFSILNFKLYSYLIFSLFYCLVKRL